MAHATDLLALDENDLTDRLVAMAASARRHADDGDVAALASLLDEVRGASDEAAGAKLRLLEVAEAFLRALARADLGRAELALRRFLDDEGERAEELVLRLVDGGSIPQAGVTALGAHGERLVELGALRALPEGRFDLRPSLRALARAQIEPPILRAWQHVERARGFAARAARGQGQKASALASRLGVTARQAERHLRLSPLPDGDEAEPLPS